MRFLCPVVFTDLLFWFSKSRRVLTVSVKVFPAKPNCYGKMQGRKFRLRKYFFLYEFLIFVMLTAFRGIGHFFSVIQRSHVFDFFENPAKVGKVQITAGFGDVVYGFIGADKQFFGKRNAFVNQIFKRGNAQGVFE